MTCRWSVDVSDSVPYGDIYVTRRCYECEYEGDQQDEVDKYARCDDGCPGFEELPGKYDTDERV